MLCAFVLRSANEIDALVMPSAFLTSKFPKLDKWATSSRDDSHHPIPARSMFTQSLEVKWLPGQTQNIADMEVSPKSLASTLSTAPTPHAIVEDPGCLLEDQDAPLQMDPPHKLDYEPSSLSTQAHIERPMESSEGSNLSYRPDLDQMFPRFGASSSPILTPRSRYANDSLVTCLGMESR